MECYITWVKNNEFIRLKNGKRVKQHKVHPNETESYYKSASFEKPEETRIYVSKEINRRIPNKTKTKEDIDVEEWIEVILIHTISMMARKLNLPMSMVK